MNVQAVRGLFAYHMAAGHRAAAAMVCSVAAVVLAATPFVGQCVTVDVTKVQQRYPWNGLVDIDYTIGLAQGESALDPTEYGVRISVVNRGVTPVVTNVAHFFRQGELPVTNGAHRVTWDANAEGVNYKSQDVKVFAEIVHHAERYMEIDVSGGPDATVYPVTYLHGAPTGGFTNSTYRYNKIALRLIPSGVFVMGSPSTELGRTADREVQHPVAITKPFYIGVFEVTQKQYANVMKSNPSHYRDDDGRPVESLNYNTIRGTANTTTHLYDWPWTNGVDEVSFMGKLRAKCKEWGGEAYDKDVDGLFDLPTEAQWEYACRAGTTTPFNDGKPCATAGDLDTSLKELGRYSGDKSDGKGGFTSGTTVVGSYNPNAWGLYDMHGNVGEWCLDWFRQDVQNIANPSVDPVGADTGSTRVIRNGCYNYGAKNQRSAARDYPRAPSYCDADYGFRLSMTLP